MDASVWVSYTVGENSVWLQEVIKGITTVGENGVWSQGVTKGITTVGDNGVWLQCSIREQTKVLQFTILVEYM